MSPPCQYCRKRKGEEGVKLFTCAGCKIELYCSKECQRAAWPTHKAKCKANQANLAQHGPLKALRAFSQRNFDNIVRAGTAGLCLRDAPARAGTHFLRLLVSGNDFGGKKATSYFVASISAEAFADADAYLGPGASGNMQQQRAWTLAQQNRPGVRPIGVFLAVVMGTDARLTNIMPLGYDPADLPDPPDLKDGDDWTKWLWKKMNVDVLVERMNQMVGMPVSKMMKGLVKGLEDPETLKDVQEMVAAMNLPPPPPDPDPEESARDILAMFKKVQE